MSKKRVDQEFTNPLYLKKFSIIKTTLKKMQQLNYELLKLDKASFEQGKETLRKSETNTSENNRNNLKAIDFKKQFYNQIEILNRQSLPLQQFYKMKVRTYFSEEK